MKIIITTILILFCFNANAVTSLMVKNKDGKEELKLFIIKGDQKIPIKEASEQFYKKFKRLQAERKAEEVIFIPYKVVVCSRLESLKAVYQRSISFNNSLTTRDLPKNCSLTKHTSYAFSLEGSGDRYIKTIYSTPFDHRVDSGWFFTNQLMTAQQREDMRNG